MTLAPSTMVTAPSATQGARVTSAGGATQTAGPGAVTPAPSSDAKGNGVISSSSGGGGDGLTKPAEIATIVSVIVGTLLAIIGIYVAVKYGKGTDRLWRDLRGLLSGRRYV
jgi:hypothetical protein